MSNGYRNPWLERPMSDEEMDYPGLPEPLDVLWVSGSAIAVAPRPNPAPEPVTDRRDSDRRNDLVADVRPSSNSRIVIVDSEDSDSDATIELNDVANIIEVDVPPSPIIAISSDSNSSEGSNQEEIDDGPALNGNSVIIIERESSDLSVVQVPNEVTTENSGVENPIIRLENPDYIPERAKSPNLAENRGAKRSYGVMMSEDDDGQTCPVCLDVWSSAGEHRLCCLKCGHLFGKSCITRWLSYEKKKYCPQCNKKASLNEIRELYATKLTALDSAEKVRLEKELDDVKEEKKKVELEMTRMNLILESNKVQIEQLKLRVANLEGDTKGENKALGKIDNFSRCIKFHLEKTLEINEGSCRVSAYNSVTNTFVVSHKSRNPLFPGFGIRKITRIGTDYYGNTFLSLHSKALRDLCFHPLIPNLILSVGFDKTAKISDIDELNPTQVFKTNNMLWSCCWDLDDPNIFYVGASNGVVFVYDVRTPGEAVTFLNPIDDYGAVVALRYSPLKLPFKGGIICCRLNSIVMYEKVSSTEYSPTPVSTLTGPFFSLSYNSETQHILASCRPSEESSKIRHVYCELTGADCQKIHTFNGGSRQTMLTRSCFLDINNETLVAAFQENPNTNTIELWSTSTGLKIQTIPVNEQVLDLIPIKTETKFFLGAITENSVRFYEAPVLGR